MAPRNNRSKATVRGITVAELMIALAVIGLMATLGYGGLVRVSESSMREASTVVAAAVRTAKQLAAQSGVHHRVVLDLEKNTVALEQCEGSVRLAFRSGDADGNKEESRIRLLQLKLDQVADSASSDAVREGAESLRQVLSEKSRCTGVESGVPFKHGIDDSGNVKISGVLVQHFEDKQTEGRVSINFFPMGYSEKAYIELTSGDENMLVSVKGLTGKVDFLFDEELGNDARDRFLGRDAIGEDQER